MNSRMRWIVVVGLVAAAVFIAAHALGLGGSDGDEELTLYGNVDIREVDMAFRVGGRIEDIPVEEGDKVSEGQLLATLDTATLESRMRAADAQLAQAQADLARVRSGSREQEVAQARARVDAAEAAARNAREDYTRRQPLVEPGAISRSQWQDTVAARDRAQAQLAEARQALSLAREGSRQEDIAVAQARVRAAEAERSSATTDLEDARLTAASAGTIITRAQEPGAIVQPGQTVLTLSIDRPLRVRAYVAETNLSRVRPGMAVTVTADGNPRSYRGQIGYISPRAEFTPKTVQTEDLRTDLVYRLRIIITNPDDALRQGQPVTVTLAAPQHREKD